MYRRVGIGLTQFNQMGNHLYDTLVDLMEWSGAGLIGSVESELKFLCLFFPLITAALF